jgi:hypothetical protein
MNRYCYGLFCFAGVKIEHIRVWDFALAKLIPPVPDEGFYTPESLIDRYLRAYDALLHRNLINTSWVRMLALKFHLNSNKASSSSTFSLHFYIFFSYFRRNLTFYEL